MLMLEKVLVMNKFSFNSLCEIPFIGGALTHIGALLSILFVRFKRNDSD